MPNSNVSMRDLHDKLPRLGSDEIILDVRAPAEFAAGHVPGSRNIPHDQVAFHLDELKAYQRIYLHCRSGKRAQVASETLRRAGLSNIVCIAGSGMEDWVALGLPTEKS